MARFLSVPQSLEISNNGGQFSESVVPGAGAERESGGSGGNLAKVVKNYTKITDLGDL